MLDGFAQVNAGLKQSFPGKFIGMAFVIVGTRFPTVDESGHCIVPNGKNRTMFKLIKKMVSNRSYHAVINNTILYKNDGMPDIMTWVRKNDGLIGFQVNRIEIGYDEGRPKSCDPTEFKKGVEAGVDFGGMFIEVHEGNINTHRKILQK